MTYSVHIIRAESIIVLIYTMKSNSLYVRDFLFISCVCVCVRKKNSASKIESNENAWCFCVCKRECTGIRLSSFIPSLCFLYRIFTLSLCRVFVSILPPSIQLYRSHPISRSLSLSSHSLVRSEHHFYFHFTPFSRTNSSVNTQRHPRNKQANSWKKRTQLAK